jgi:hypothetical protein
MVPPLKSGRFLSRDSVRRLEGFTELAVDATEAVVNATERVHRSYARKPFVILERIEPIAGPVKVVEELQVVAVGSIFAAIRTIAGMSGIVVVHVLHELERR